MPIYRAHRRLIGPHTFLPFARSQLFHTPTRNFSVAKSDIFSQNSLACQSHPLSKIFSRKIGHTFPQISRIPISPALKNFLSQNRRHFPKNLSRANLIHSRKNSLAKSDTFSQKSLACQSHSLSKIFSREIGHIFPKISRVPISLALENFLSQNRTHFPKILSHANLIQLTYLTHP